MKNSKWLFLVCLVLVAFSGYSQSYNREPTFLEDQFKNLQIGYSKTTSIVFPYAIKSIDKGSQSILMQKAKGVENVLLLKAGEKNFSETNLTVVTSDGKLYVFILNYNEECPDLNLKVNPSVDLSSEIVFSRENENQKKIEEFTELALFKKKKIISLKREKFGVKLQLNGLLIHQDVIYFRLVLGNDSNINYDIDQLRFFIRDQKKPKRTASQEIEIMPILKSSDISTIADKSEATIVFALPKFTIPEKKYLTIQLIEKNGGRQIGLNIKNNDMNKLEVLNSL